MSSCTMPASLAPRPSLGPDIDAVRGVELAPRKNPGQRYRPGSASRRHLRYRTLDQDAAEALVAGFVAKMPRGRIGETDDIVPWITRLAEPTSSLVTGKVFGSDGGRDLAP